MEKKMREVSELAGAEIVVYTRGWLTDRPIVEGEVPTSQLDCRVVLDGRELDHVTGISVETAGGQWAEAKIAVVPATIRFVPLTNDEFVLDLAELSDK